jgi:histidinol-phosphatase (PHP family)
LPVYDFDSDTLEREYLRLLNECKRLDIPVEFNYLGYSHNRHYPKRKLFELCEKAKCSVIVGLDTHDPREIVNPQNQVNNALNGLNLTFITKPIL